MYKTAISLQRVMSTQSMARSLQRVMSTQSMAGLRYPREFMY